MWTKLWRKCIRRPAPKAVTPRLSIERLEARETPAVGAFDVPAAVATNAGFGGVIALMDINGTTCSGTLLDNGRYILTAAHCVNSAGGTTPDSPTYTIRFDLPSGSITLTVPAANVSINPSWAGEDNIAAGNDVALIRLDELAPFGNGTSKLGFGLYTNTDEIGQNFNVYGYGLTGTGTTGINRDADGEIQRLTITAVAGTYTLTVNGEVTNNLAFNATAAEIETALEALPSINDVDVFLVNSNNNPYNGSFEIRFNNPTNVAGAMTVSGGAGVATVIYEGDLSGIDKRTVTNAFTAAENGGILRSLFSSVANTGTTAAGDSGGPAFIGNQIAGITSFGDIITPESSFGDMPGFARVSSFLNSFINPIINAGPYSTALDMNNQVPGNDGNPDTIIVNQSGTSFTVTVNGVLYYTDAGSNITSFTITGSTDVTTVFVTGNVATDIVIQNATLAGTADVGVTKTVSNAAPVVGSNFTFTVTLFNTAGPNAGVGIVVTDVLPSGLTFVSSSVSQGSYNSNTGQWTAGTIGVGNTATLTLTARAVSSSVNTTVTNTATITASTSTDPNPSNNTSNSSVVPRRLSLPDFVVTGADQGTQPRVTVTNANTTQQTLSFLAFDSTFMGGVRVATGDIDGDGVFDIIVGAGPGAGPHVKVFSSTTGQQIAGPLGSFFAFDAGFDNGLFVASGDLNNDGTWEVIVSADAGAGPHVKAFEADGTELYSFFAFDQQFHGGVRVASGDVNGDFFDDIVVGAGPGAGPHVKVFDGNTGLTILSFFAFDLTFDSGIYVSAAALLSTSQADVIVGAGQGAGPHVRAFNAQAGMIANFFAYEAETTKIALFVQNFLWTEGVRVGAVDLDGNGIGEIVTGPGQGRRPLVRVFDATLQVPITEFFGLQDNIQSGIFVS